MKKETFEINYEFGQIVYDDVTWFTGKVTAKATYQYSQDEYLVESTVWKDGKFESVWFTKARLLSEPTKD